MTLALVSFGAAAALGLFAVEAKKPVLFGFAKPAVIVALLAVAGVPPVGRFQTLIVVGLVLCLIGDVALLKETPRAFMTGLVLFLLAHLTYVAAFLAGGGAGPLSAGPLAAGSAVVLATVWLVRRLWPHVSPSLRGPLVFYGAAISTMVASSFFLLGGPWPSRVSGVTALGALVFYFSDANLAWNRFYRAYPHHQTVTLSLYWAGQLGIALAAREVG